MPALPPLARSSRRRPQGGFMLMEVLIAVLLFSVGVLALVGLQARMTQAQTDAKVRADAAYLATEVIGLMWADTTNVGQYVACTGNGACEAWKAKVAANLPSGLGAVSSPVAADPSIKQITITWTMPSGDSHQFVTTTQIKAAGA